MNTPMRKIPALLGMLMLPLAGSQALAAAFTLSNTPGEGSVSVGVDGYGAFGSSIGANTSNANYTPVGGGASAGTTFQSYLALRLGDVGSRALFNNVATGTNPSVSGTPTSGASSFSHGALNFALTQTLSALITGGVQTGSRLTQRYVITNTNTSTTPPILFELLRYIDADLDFDGSLIDGGGRIASPSEILFEIDSATGAGTDTTFLGITATGGTIPSEGRYEIDSFSGLRTRVTAGTALDNTVTGDGADADQFIDAGSGYDVTLALRNLFSLDAGGSATYITETFFGSGLPGEVVVEPCGVPGTPECAIPEPGSLALLGLALAGFGASRRFRKS